MYIVIRDSVGSGNRDYPMDVRIHHGIFMDIPSKKAQKVGGRMQVKGDSSNRGLGHVY